ncbi:MAG: hypothetical protein RBT35_08465, partial [Bacteroidales bacterium]|nr:hypothetical protein [Bacteroidales bacterium]
TRLLSFVPYTLALRYLNIIQAQPPIEAHALRLPAFAGLPSLRFGNMLANLNIQYPGIEIFYYHPGTI